jgi:hypothetical protein
VKVSSSSNVYLLDEDITNLNNQYEVIATSSPSKEKLIVSLSNITRAGNKLPIEYPLTV